MEIDIPALLRGKKKMALFNEIIHQPIRLRIMADIVNFPLETLVTFKYLKDALKLTDGNLGAHLHKLEEVGYLTIIKTFVSNKPQTYVKITETGRQAFVEHCKALRDILEGNEHIDNHDM